jgi:hypothetical protein
MNSKINKWFFNLVCIHYIFLLLGSLLIGIINDIQYLKQLSLKIGILNDNWYLKKTAFTYNW